MYEQHVNVTTLLHRYCQPPYARAWWSTMILNYNVTRMNPEHFSAFKTLAPHINSTSICVFLSIACLHNFVLFFIGTIIYSPNNFCIAIQNDASKVYANRFIEWNWNRSDAKGIACAHTLTYVCACDLLVNEYVHCILDFPSGESEIGYVENRSMYSIHILYTYVSVI